LSEASLPNHLACQISQALELSYATSQPMQYSLLSQQCFLDSTFPISVNSKIGIHALQNNVSLVIRFQKSISIKHPAEKNLLCRLIKSVNYFLFFLALARAITLFISLFTIIYPSSTPIPGLARHWSAPQAIAMLVQT
jgi:hypothetical protein